MLVALRVAPFVLVCLVDTQIFYQLLLMIWGLVYGLTSLNLGIAGSWEGLRAEFHRAPLRWWARCMSGTANQAALAAAEAATRKHGREAGDTLAAFGAGFCRARSDDEDSECDGDVFELNMPDCTSPAKASSSKHGTGQVAVQQDGGAVAGFIPAIWDGGKKSGGPSGGQAEDNSSSSSSSKAKGRTGKRDAAAAAELVAMLAGQGEEQLAQWMAFAAAWDAVVEDLRCCDLISDREKSNLVFTRLPAAATAMLCGASLAAVTDSGDVGSAAASAAAPGTPSSPDSGGGSEYGSSHGDSSGRPGVSARPLRPFLLPAFFYAGQVQRVVDTGSASPSQQLVLSELRSLLVWLGCQLRLLDGPQAAALLSVVCCPAALDAAHSLSREKGLAALRSLLRAMQALSEPLPPPASSGVEEAQRRRRALYSEVTTALAGVLAALEVEARAVLKARLGAGKGSRAAIRNPGSSAAPPQGAPSEGQDEAQGAVQDSDAVDPQAAALALLEAVAALRSCLVGRPERLSAAMALMHPENGGCGDVPAAASASVTSEEAKVPSWFRSTPTSVSVDLRLLARVLSTASKMLNLSSAAAQPTGAEARRILGFFVTSLANRQLCKPCPVACMPSWTVLTPLYAEDVLFPLEARQVAEALGLGAGAGAGTGPGQCGGAKPQPQSSSTSSSSSLSNLTSSLPDLLTETEERVSLMAYIRSLYPKDWENFKERLGASLGGLDLSAATECDFAEGGSLADHALSLQLWASYRGQLLARTVRGMAAYERAVRVLATLESPRPAGVGRREHAAVIEDMVGAKFTHVVASQLYGHNRRSSSLRDRWLAESTDVLLEAFPYLRVSYLDTLPVDKVASAAVAPPGAVAPPPAHQYAVLIRGRKHRGGDCGGACGRTEELYRVRLPYNRYSKRGIILGEGKPENQNHAAIFCFGEALQTIDMNQDNALAEALKMRNLLGELRPERHTRAAKHALAALQAAMGPASGTADAPLLPPAADFKRLLSDLRVAEQPVAVVGFREWVFSDKAGALGSFAASSEFAFSTMVQRTMAYPANVRLHYGHPDAFNKIFAMTRVSSCQQAQNPRCNRNSSCMLLIVVAVRACMHHTVPAVFPSLLAADLSCCLAAALSSNQPTAALARPLMSCHPFSPRAVSPKPRGSCTCPKTFSAA